MASEKLPWFSFYASDFLLSPHVQAMSDQAVGVYTKLLCHSWIDEGIPSDEKTLRLLAGKNYAEVWPEIEDCWEPHPEDPSRLINVRQEAERMDAYATQEKTRKQRSDAGKASARAKAKAKAEREANGRSTGVQRESTGVQRNSTKSNNMDKYKDSTDTPEETPRRPPQGGTAAKPRNKREGLTVAEAMAHGETLVPGSGPIIREWMDYQTAINRKRWVQATWTKVLKHAEGSAARLRAAVDHSIAGGHPGLYRDRFEPESSTGAHRPSQGKPSPRSFEADMDKIRAMIDPDPGESTTTTIDAEFSAKEKP